MAKSKGKSAQELLEEGLQLEMDIISTSTTAGGVLKCLPGLFTVLRKSPLTIPLLLQLDDSISQEDIEGLHDLEKANSWVFDRLRELNPFMSKFMQHEILDVLTFKIFPFDGTGYFFTGWGCLLRACNNLKKLHLYKLPFSSSFYKWALENPSSLLEGRDIKYNCNNSLLLKMTKIVPIVKKEEISSLGPCVLLHPYSNEPDFVTKCLKRSSIEKRALEWKELIDSKLEELYRFLKILSQYETYIPVTLDPENPLIIESFKEMEAKIVQAHVGYYLSCFSSVDYKKHSLTKDELISLISRFIKFIKKKMFDPHMKGKQLESYLSKKAEQYSSDWLIQRVSLMTNEERRLYTYEKAFAELKRMATDTCLIDYVSETMLKERAGPFAKKCLQEKHSIDWAPAPGRGKKGWGPKNFS